MVHLLLLAAAYVRDSGFDRHSEAFSFDVLENYAKNYCDFLISVEFR